jgi:serine/threonine protein kinase/formylglycine-generating enzyme required for sulfatase activity
MSPEKWQEISKIFHIALEKKPAKRRAYLDEICGEDAEFRHEIEVLLIANDEKDSFIDSPKVGLVNSGEPPSYKNGDRIGSFKIIELLGAGGMGEVYLAKDLRLNRNVALKFLTLMEENANKRFLREAQAAAALEHPHICTIHEIARENSREFIVMQYIEGETLSSLIKKGPLPIAEAVDIALQVAEALTEAHFKGIVHRDIKPANIIVSANKQVKVLDFGLAKRVTFDVSESESSFKTLLSSPGMVLGTVSYMSPEQVRGQAVDHRTDLWSLGMVIYEMLSGKTLFAGISPVEKLAAILYQRPEKHLKIPPELDQVLEKSLEKDLDKRYQSAAQMMEDLRYLKQELDFEEQLLVHVTSPANDKEINQKISQYLSEHPTLEIKSFQPPKRSFGWKNILVFGAIGSFLVFAGFYLWKYYKLNKTHENIIKAEKLATAEKNFEAYDLAVEAEKFLPLDETLAKVLPTISDTLTVNSEPAGARVYLRRYDKSSEGKFPERELIGETPIKDLRIARGQYILQVEKEGFAKFERTISGIIPRVGGSFIASPPLKIETKLIESTKVPERMVFVPGSEYGLVNWSRSTEKKVKLDDFFIDKYEVTNAEYKEFILAGGYVKMGFWKVPFFKEGKVITMDEALKFLKDKTGLPGPRSWTNQSFPEGKANFPVTDITWYEAAAYAEFRGKKLPSVFQWEKSARDGAFDPRYNAMPWGFIKQGETTDNRANFRGTGTVAADENEFGMSPFGALNMAGNVSEWNLNQSPQGFVTSGGAWNDLVYSFGDYGEYPGFFASNRIGFRCVLNSTGTQSDEGGQMIPQAETPDYPVSSDNDFKSWLTHYEYDKKPLNAQIIETKDEGDWTREKISFNGEGGEQALAFLYLPKNAARPIQVLQYVPPGDVVRGIHSLPDSIEMFATPFIKSGRAVFAVVLKGYIDRPFPNNYNPPENSTVEFRKQMVNWITDLRLGLDYLETRDDLDKQKLGFLGISNGANVGLVLTAIENRYKSLAFISAGLEKDFRGRLPETSPIKFASQIKTQKFFINGKYDETFPYNTDAKPLFKLLREPKKIVIYDGGHIPTPEFYAPAVNEWFDETLGKILR